MKKLMILVLAVALFTAVSCDDAFEYRPVLVEEGTIGSLTWTLFNDGILTISGDGEITDYNSGESQPWVSNNKKIGSVVFEGDVTGIGAYTFSGCSNMKSITLPNTVAKIGKAAFFNCSSLTEVIIPEDVTTIGLSAFHGCSKLLKVVVLAAVPPTLAEWNFTASNDILYVPADKVSVYNANAAWKSAFSQIEEYAPIPAP